eukprot:scaffold116091_cov19-Tisochrysis_lutea.AAC.2
MILESGITAAQMMEDRGFAFVKEVCTICDAQPIFRGCFEVSHATVSPPKMHPSCNLNDQ